MIAKCRVWQLGEKAKAGLFWSKEESSKIDQDVQEDQHYIDLYAEAAHIGTSVAGETSAATVLRVTGRAVK